MQFSFATLTLALVALTVANPILMERKTSTKTKAAAASGTASAKASKATAAAKVRLLQVYFPFWVGLGGLRHSFFLLLGNLSKHRNADNTIHRAQPQQLVHPSSPLDKPTTIFKSPVEVPVPPRPRRTPFSPTSIKQTSQV